MKLEWKPALGTAALVLLIVTVLGWWNALGPFGLSAEVFLVDDRNIEDESVVAIWVHHPTCSDGYRGPVRFEMNETPQEVTIHAVVRRRLPALGCSSVFDVFEASVELTAPVGERELWDASANPPTALEVLN
jgi:hypothetical protein